ncbi:uncharacterized protein KQ657_001750 [Scheffersomyces spartinae]|uniref:Peptidase M20 dimerisation domain-containing protein n=1 Tax=Scheffersomyces spartinae TaxID=45513 RepID=A0A9P7V6X7_9ASCO|nr:uncharacterized protein KQ657_001750 [Scheffersomyces spartinae]KAG7192352.1 hypothetical protein KQ657_001750 [Scheffersomyces spartinae]
MQLTEKKPVPTGSSRKYGFIVTLLGILVLITLSLYKGGSGTFNSIILLTVPKQPDSLCPLVKKINPIPILSSNGSLDTLNDILHSKEYRNKSLSKFQGALRIPTQIFDEMAWTLDKSDDEVTWKDLFESDERWQVFQEFHQYLKKTFPLVHEHLKLETPNKLALVYTWKGSDTSLKPILLTAHQDVVPVPPETEAKWHHPAFDAFYDEETGYVTARGVSDCKNLLIGLLEAVETLLEEGTFQPKRTIILGFGYDEESRGEGALHIHDHLIQVYGEDSILMIVDEGNDGYFVEQGLNIIAPSVGEKGYLDLSIQLNTPGGHSSIPPAHTGIGLMSLLVAQIEHAPFKPQLSGANPTLNQLYCLAEHSPTIGKSLKSDILKSHFDPGANGRIIDYISQSHVMSYLLKTSQAADIVRGGLKVNALPEVVELLVNHRIAVEDSVASTRDKIVKDILVIAREFDLGVVVDGEEIRETSIHGYFNYTSQSTLEPAPVTPTSGPVWELFGGSLLYLYEDLLKVDNGNQFVFAPALSIGNTDTKRYWDLTKHIYRYQPAVPQKNSQIHAIDEQLLFDSHLTVVAFYYYFLQVADSFREAL